MLRIDKVNRRNRTLATGSYTADFNLVLAFNDETEIGGITVLGRDKAYLEYRTVRIKIDVVLLRIRRYDIELILTDRHKFHTVPTRRFHAIVHHVTLRQPSGTLVRLSDGTLLVLHPCLLRNVTSADRTTVFPDQLREIKTPCRNELTGNVLRVILAFLTGFHTVLVPFRPITLLLRKSPQRRILESVVDVL